jgi:primosomal protein N'
MKVIEVIPISKGIARETLSYFSIDDIPLGSIVEVPVRTRKVPALVIAKRSAHEIKGEIKSATFAIKKVTKIKFSHFFLPEFIEAAQKVARYSSSTTGAALNALIPKSLLEFAQNKKIKICDNDSPRGPEKHVLQRCEDERLDIYKSLIREEFAKKSSVYICLPTIEETYKMWELLKKGIENYTVMLHGSLKEKELDAALKQGLEETHPVLIVGTGSFLSIPRKDIGTYIVEKEASRFYKQFSRPFVDWRRCAELLAESRRKRLIFADSLLRTETIWRTKNGDLIEHEPLSFKVFDSPSPVVVDMKKYKESTEAFRVFSDDLIDSTKEVLRSGGRLMFFGARRGLAPSVICNDCGASVLCNQCQTGVVLHQSANKDENYFLCHHCGEKRPAEERCATCTSWRLMTLGIGTELIEKEAMQHFPEANVIRLDKDSAKTEKQAFNLIKKFYETPGSILVGTETALPYLTNSIDFAAIISFDSFFSIPDFRTNEKIMGIILKIRSLGKKGSCIQTRTTDEKVLDYGVRGNLLDFYKEEIKLREAFGYPPFKTLIKISFDGKKPSLISDLEQIHELLQGYDFTVFPAFVKNHKGTHTTHILLKADSQTWPDDLLIEKLLSLPPAVTIKVDPDSIL